MLRDLTDSAALMARVADGDTASFNQLVARLHDVEGATSRVMLCAPVAFSGRPGVTPELATQYDETAKAVRALSRRLGVGFTQDGHKGGTVRAAAEAGLLGPDALLSHCIDLHEDEIRLIAESGTKVAHNPSANFSVIGRCPAIELMDAGATVAICSDGTAPDRSFDMFRHMTQAMHYHRRHFRDAKVLPPGKALEMITCDAAAALGMAAEIGSLEAGKLADLVVLDKDPTVDIRNSETVHRVMIGGRMYDPRTMNEDFTGTRTRAPYWWE